jgi:hypothetical protein
LKNFYEGLNIKTPITCKNKDNKEFPALSEFKFETCNSANLNKSLNNEQVSEEEGPKEIEYDTEEKVEKVKNTKENTKNPTDFKWKFEIKSHPNHLIKNLKGFYNKYNILLKDFGFNVYELVKGKVTIQSNIIEGGPRDPKFICYKLVKGSFNTADDIVKKIQYEIELFESGKKEKKLK